MKLFRVLTAIAVGILAFTASPCRAESYEPSGTYMFAQKDSCSLFLDIYEPADSSVRAIDGKEKPTIIFAFGGGFMSGERNNASYFPWYRMLNEAGYRVVAIDYRLGLKDFKGAGFNPKFTRALLNSIRIAVEDLFSATQFLIDNSDELGIDCSSLVISGSSAGAITAMQAEWEICNGTDLASSLPEGFNYAGVMSFAGAVFSTMGGIRYRKAEPCPTMMCHGTDDQTVPYGQMRFFRLCFAGTDVLTNVFAKNLYNYNTFRFQGHRHEIAAGMEYCFDKEIEFLESNVMKGEKRIVDTLIDDPSIPMPDWAKGDYKNIYD